MAAKFASMMLPRMSNRVEHMMSSSFAVRWPLNSRVTRIAQCGLLFRTSESTPQVPDASRCSLKPCCGGKEILCIGSDHVHAKGFDVLRQHNQDHELGTRRRVSALDTDPCKLLSVRHFLSGKQCSIPHVAVSHLWKYLSPDPSG